MGLEKGADVQPEGKRRERITFRTRRQQGREEENVLHLCFFDPPPASWQSPGHPPPRRCRPTLPWQVPGPWLGRATSLIRGGLKEAMVPGPGGHAGNEPDVEIEPPEEVPVLGLQPGPRLPVQR